MKRILTNLTVLLVVFVVFALIISPLRNTPVGLTILFFPTIQTSAETLAYISFFIGLVLAGVIAIGNDFALRKKFRAMQLEQRKRLDTTSQTDAATSVNAEPADQGTRPQ